MDAAVEVRGRGEGGPGEGAGWRRAVWALIGVTTAARIAWAATLGPGNDEAYHSLFAAHLDWSYIDHPPMTALVERAGLLLAGALPRTLALRLGFVAMAAGSTALMARLGARLFGPRAGFLAAFLLNATAYYGWAAGAFALPDGPLLFFWLLTLDLVVAAMERPERTGRWLGVGLAWAGALLSKYHAVFLPVGVAAYLLADRRGRAVLRTPGPYLAAGVGLLGFLPVIGWNAAHGWASFVFQGSRALGSWRPRPDALLGAIGGQALYFLPWIWLPLVISLVRHARRWRRGEAADAERFLLAQAAAPLGAFLGVACFRSVLPHWSLIGLLPVIPLLAADWSGRWDAERATLRRRLTWMAALPVLLVLVVAVHVRTGFLQRSPGRLGLVPPMSDPTGDLAGWDQLADALRQRGLDHRPETFLFTGRWYTSGHLQYALGPDAPEVLCYNRHHAQNFAYWSRPEDWVGMDAVYVGFNDDHAELADFTRYFASVEPIGDVPILRRGEPVRVAHLYLCHRQLRPFPFGNAARTPRPGIRPLPPALDLAYERRGEAPPRPVTEGGSP